MEVADCEVLQRAEKMALTEKLKIEEGDLILFGADKRETVWEVLGRLRLVVADLLKKQGALKVRDDQWNFLWVVDFPLITFDRESNRYLSTHHPFTAPVIEDVPLIGLRAGNGSRTTL
jgi:aspartyl-tRNA synthetase